MLLPDSNFWLALALSKHQFHSTATGWLARRPARESLAFCRMTQSSCLRLLTTASVTERLGIPALTNDEAWAVYEQFAASKRIRYVLEPPGLNAIWKKLASRPTASPKLWMDAYLAAFAMAGGHRLVTTDTGFRQFAGLDVVVLGK